MKKQYRRLAVSTLSTALGVALTAGLASAQSGSMSGQGSMSGMRSGMPMSDTMPDGTKMLTEEELQAFPVAQEFPQAAPDTGLLFHYNDFGRTGPLVEGSVYDAQLNQQRQLDYVREQLLKPTYPYSDSRRMGVDGMYPNTMTMSDTMPDGTKMLTEEELQAFPVAQEFPQGAPDTGLLFHYNDFGRIGPLVEGSVYDAQLNQQKQIDYEREQLLKPTYPYPSGANSGMMMMERDAMDLTDEEKDQDPDIVPLAVDYPVAAPGTVSLFHYRDYTKVNGFGTGSVSDAMYRKLKMKDEMMMGNGMSGGSSMSGGSMRSSSGGRMRSSRQRNR